MVRKHFVILLGLLVWCITPAYADMNKLLQMSEKLDQMDKADFDAALAEADRCTRARDFVCTETQLGNAKKFVHNNKDKQDLLSAHKKLAAEKSIAEEERRQQAAMLAAREAERQRIAEMERQQFLDAIEAEEENEPDPWMEAAKQLPGIIEQNNQFKRQLQQQREEQRAKQQAKNAQYIAQAQRNQQYQQQQYQQQLAAQQQQRQQQQQAYERQMEEQRRQQERQAEEQRKQQELTDARADRCVEFIREQRAGGVVWLYVRNGCGKPLELLFCTTGPGADHQCGVGAGAMMTVGAGSHRLASNSTKTAAASVTFRACFQPYVPSFERAEGCWR